MLIARNSSWRHNFLNATDSRVVSAEVCKVVCYAKRRQLHHVAYAGYFRAPMMLRQGLIGRVSGAGNASRDTSGSQMKWRFVFSVRETSLVKEVCND